MKERPMLFNAAMVRAILDGRKTQTRRVAPIEEFSVRKIGEGMVAWRIGFTKPMGKDRVISRHSGGRFTREQAAEIVAHQLCPYGQPGDRLWVRETWRVRGGQEYEYQRDRSQVMYRATHGEDGYPLGWESYDWRPSIHMPRWASRITLEITGVRVERLGDISKSDAIAEGIDSIRVSENDSRWLNYQDPESKAAAYGDPRQSFWSLWESINGPDSCEANPWVWAIEFRRVNA